MPRFELSEGTSNKFWEIELEGSSFTTRYGRIGTDGQETTKSFATPAEAKKQYDKLIAEKTKKGYEPAGGDEDEEEDDEDDREEQVFDEAKNPELEAKIIASPSDVHAYQVYADWLQSKGDPRGELIAVQNALLTSPGSAPLRAAEAAVLKKYAARFLGKTLTKHATTRDGNDKPAYVWHLGFIKSARFAWDHYADEESGDVDLGAVVGGLLKHPSGKFLEELTIGLNRADPDCEYQGIVDAIAEQRAPALRTLFIGDYEYPDDIEISWTKIGNLDAAWKSMPHLEKLILQGGDIELGAIHAPALEHLELRTGGLPSAAVQAIAAAKFPALETLILWTGSDNYGGTTTFQDLAPILEGEGLPKLKHLGIMNSDLADDVCKAIGRAKILPRLESLDLSMGTMTDEGRLALVEAKSSLKHLKSLNVENNVLGNTEGLAGLCAKVQYQEQRDDEGEDDDRYVMVGE